MDICNELVRIAKELSAEKDVTAWIDDPNPKTIKCPKCGRTIEYDMHTMTYRCKNCPYYARGISRLASTSRKASEFKEIDQTFQTVTPESAEEGDFADSGFTGRGWSFDYAEEAYQFLKNEGVIWVNGAGEAGGWWESSSPDIDYSTAAETTYGYHPKGFTDEEIDYINRRLGGCEKENEFDDVSDEE